MKILNVGIGLKSTSPGYSYLLLVLRLEDNFVECCFMVCVFFILVISAPKLEVIRYIGVRVSLISLDYVCVISYLGSLDWNCLFG